ncbi:hypothetical protein B4V02_05560 [Paenibacillus kribbensis]|uniref:Uncharacterized protein n=1 Tax=Paenibacillus kribbensis TaxID=172713 RepID=A0A222WK60_9BACL|nr:hypothetical protein [Paenibacillus kribbensis]ASR46193.1 hypothetical protein B4V02_05560 [Paenibacillus kribbensis]
MGIRFCWSQTALQQALSLPIVEQALGSTAVHSARMQQAPSSSVQRMHNEAIPAEYERYERIYEQVWEGYSPYGRDCEVYASDAYAPTSPKGDSHPTGTQKKLPNMN